MSLREFYLHSRHCPDSNRRPPACEAGAITTRPQRLTTYLGEMINLSLVIILFNDDYSAISGQKRVFFATYLLFGANVNEIH